MAAGSADAGDLGQGTAATERGISGANRGAACRFLGGNHRGGQRCADAVLRIARSQGASFGVWGLPPERPCVDYKRGHSQEFGPRLINVLRSAPPRIHPAIPRLFRIGETHVSPVVIARKLDLRVGGVVRVPDRAAPSGGKDRGESGGRKISGLEAGDRRRTETPQHGDQPRAGRNHAAPPPKATFARDGKKHRFFEFVVPPLGGRFDGFRLKRRDYEQGAVS